MPILLRLGEITLKSNRTRGRFESLLVHNIIAALKMEGLKDFQILRERGRIFIYLRDEELERKAIDVLRRVFGITSLSPVKELCFKTLSDIAKYAEELFKDYVKDRSFAVRVKRVGKHDFTSLDVAREVGAVLYKYAKRVNLTNPERTVYVEIRNDKAYFYTEVIRAFGGLPIGSEGKVVALVSGGYDSAVAAWFMLRRGAKVEYVFCNLGGLAHELGVLGVLKVLAEKWSYGYSPVLHVVDFTRIVKEMDSKCDRSLFNVVLKRFMYRVAEAIAGEVGARAIVTGDSLGQVSSQTLQNLYVSSLAIKMQVLRPLIGFDKEDIIRMAKEIGTYEASSQVIEFCAFYSRKPKTRARLEEVENEEAKMNVEELVNEAVKNRRVVSILEAKTPSLKELIIGNIPQDSVVIDLRSPEEYSEWHYPNAINVPFQDLLGFTSKLSRDKIYVLYCDEGSLSIEAAFLLNKMGYKAYSLHGGTRKLRRICQLRFS